MAARIVSFVLKTVAEFFAAGVPVISNGVYDVFRYTLGTDGKVSSVELGCQYYTAPSKLSAFGKVVQWAPIPLEQFGGQIVDRPFMVTEFDLATGVGMGAAGKWRFSYCVAPVVGEDAPPYLLPVKLASVRNPSTSPASRYNSDGEKSAPKRKIVASTPVKEVVKIAPPVTEEMRARMDAALRVGTTQNERDAAAGVTRQTAAARKLNERKMDAAERAAEKRAEPK